jgi:hypothetical protein
MSTIEVPKSYVDPRIGGAKRIGSARNRPMSGIKGIKRIHMTQTITNSPEASPNSSRRKLERNGKVA